MLVKLTYAPIDAPWETRSKEYNVKEIKGNREKLCFILNSGDYVAVDIAQLKSINIR